MRTRALATLFSVALFAALPVRGACAQPASDASKSIDDAKAAAKASADKGQKLYDAGKYADAITAFREADQKFHAPTFVLMIARAHAKLGLLRDARSYYKWVADEKLAHYAPKVFFAAQAHARKELRALIPRVPSLRVWVKGAPTKAVHLTIDGIAVSVGRSVPLDPGVHAVEATGPDDTKATRKVILKESEKSRITLKLEKYVGPPSESTPEQTPPPAPVAAPAPAPPPPAEPVAPAPEAPSKGGFSGAAVVAFSLGGLGIGVGAVTGVISLGEASSLESDCPGGKCYNNAGGAAYDNANKFATVSTVSFIVGGVAAAAGVVLVLWPSDEPGASVGVVAGPGWAGVRGAF